MKRFLLAAVFAFVSANAHAADAPAATPSASPSVELGGDIPAPGFIKLEGLEQLEPGTETWKDGDGSSHEVYGVPLYKLMAQMGFAPGAKGKGIAPREKRLGLRKILRISAADGFEAVFSAAEVWDGVGSTKAFLVWKMDGKPLPPGAGPFRIVVLTDKDASRCIYKVTSIEMIDLRKK